MGRFKHYYLIEVSGESKMPGLLNRSAKEVMQTVIDILKINFNNNKEKISVRIGDVSCEELETIKKHKCWREILLK